MKRLYGNKPDLSSIPSWGQTGWVHSSKGSKLDARGVEARWVGFDTKSTHAHRMYWPEKRAVSVERDVKFNTPNYILYPENYPSLPQTGTPVAPPAPPAVPPLVPPAPPPPVQQAPLPPPQAPATPAQSAPQSTLTPSSSLSRASSGGSPAMPGGLQPEAPDQPRAPPSSSFKRQGQSTRRTDAQVNTDPATLSQRAGHPAQRRYHWRGV
jgi:hypothetical protein